MLRFVGYWQRVKGAEIYEKFLKRYPTRSYKKGTIILSEGEVPRSAYIIKKGIVRAHLLTNQGEIKPVGLHLMGDVFPLAWAFDRMRTSGYYYDAFTDIQVAIVPRQEYTQFVMENQEVLAYMFRKMVDKYIAAMLRVGSLEYSKASEKVLHRLHYLCIYYGRDVKKDLVEIQLPLTQQELANSMGLTRETTGIELKKLERSGVLQRKNGKYLVRTNKLNDLLDEDYNLRRSDHNMLDAIE